VAETENKRTIQLKCCVCADRTASGLPVHCPTRPHYLSNSPVQHRNSTQFSHQSLTLTLTVSTPDKAHTIATTLERSSTPKTLATAQPCVPVYLVMAYLALVVLKRCRGKRGPWTGVAPRKR